MHVHCTYITLSRESKLLICSMYFFSNSLMWCVRKKGWSKNCGNVENPITLFVNSGMPSSNIFHTILIKICSIITSNLSEWWFKFTYGSLFGWISSKTEKVWVEHKRMTLWGIPVPVTWKIISNFAFSSSCQTRSSVFWKLYFKKLRLLINYPSCSHWYVPRQFYELQAILLKNYLPEWSLIM